MFETMNDASLLQTWAYGDAKTRSGAWSVTRLIIVDGDRRLGIVQAFIRKLPLIGGGLVWINRGPLLADGRWREVLDALYGYFVVDRRMLVRLALPLREPVDLSLILPPQFRAADAGSGYQSARLDLSLSLEELRRQLDQKWRHGLNKAERAGAYVESGEDDRLLDDVLADYAAMMTRKTLQTSVTPQLLGDLQKALPPSQKLWSIIARDAKAVAGFVLVARYGRTAEYLAGSSNESGRKWNVGNLLLWRAISEMKEQGYHWFDVGGMDSVRTPPGIYHFKAGLGGAMYSLPNEVEASPNGLRSFVVRRAIRRARAGSAS